MLLAKEETVLQGMIERVIEIGRCYGMERSVGKAKVMRISRQTSPVQMMIDQKQPKNVEYFNYLGSVIANDARCTGKLNPDCHCKSGIQQQVEEEEDGEAFHQLIGLKFKEEVSKMLHLERSYVWCLSLDASESRSEIPGKF